MSNKPKWTPGPWSAEDVNGWWVITDTDNEEMGSGDGGFYFEDANLIAAAPELYEALDMMIEADLYLTFDINAISDLLAKARGES